MTLTLELYRATSLDRARGWADLNPEERRRRAVEAARDKDAEALWSLTEAYLTLHGANGTSTSPRTLRTYSWAVRKFVDYAGTQAVNLLRASSGDGVQSVRTVEAAGLSPSSSRVQLAGVRLLYKALRWAGATDASPFGDVQAVRERTAPWDKRAPYSAEEVRNLLAHADGRMRVLLLLCAHGGLRISETLALQWADVQLAALELRVTQGKGGKQRRVVFGQTLRGALDQLPGERCGPVVGGSYPAAVERLRRLCSRVDVPYRGYHALRHYAGTRLVGEGASLDDVARHLGHATIETTRVYAKWNDAGLRRRLSEW